MAFRDTDAEKQLAAEAAPPVDLRALPHLRDGIYTLTLPLTPEEVLERVGKADDARKLSYETQIKLEVDHKKAGDALKALIKSYDVDRDLYLRQAAAANHDVEVKVEYRLDITAKERVVIRKDTGEEIARQKATADDLKTLQPPLPSLVKGGKTKAEVDKGPASRRLRSWSGGTENTAAEALVQLWHETGELDPTPENLTWARDTIAAGDLKTLVPAEIIERYSKLSHEAEQELLREVRKARIVRMIEAGEDVREVRAIKAAAAQVREIRAFIDGASETPV